MDCSKKSQSIKPGLCHKNQSNLEKIVNNLEQKELPNTLWKAEIKLILAIVNSCFLLNEHDTSTAVFFSTFFDWRNL